MRRTNDRTAVSTAIEYAETAVDGSSLEMVALVAIGKAQALASLAVAEALGELDRLERIDDRLRDLSDALTHIQADIETMPNVRWKTDAS